MLDIKYCRYEPDDSEWLETNLTGKLLLNTSLLNKGTAFSLEERELFGLAGKLPFKIETLEEQVQRAYEQYKRYQTDLSRNIYLNNLRDRNETLFYRLVSQYVEEMLPIIYTPIVGTAVKAYSREFRAPRGLYLSYPERAKMRELLQNRSHPSVDLIVATDGAGVLGIGDQGIGAMDIPIAKLMVYTLFAGIHPSRTLPIMLDVGTNNTEMLEDPLYLGWRHPRIDDEDYDQFIAQFVAAVQAEFPHIFLHWEDLGQLTAKRVLTTYQDVLCTFNDDIQGTGVAALAAVLAGSYVKQETLSEQRIVIFGAGTAGMGIAEQIVAALVLEGLSLDAARKRCWLLDKHGLITRTTPANAAQQPYARHDVHDWPTDSQGIIGLSTVIEKIHPTVLIGCSACAGAFTETVIRAMAHATAEPIILPLSNPTERAEATAENILRWTDGRAMIATGSPFAPVQLQQTSYVIPQCNNALAFPGIGLGVLSVKATRLSAPMLAAAACELAKQAPIMQDRRAPLLPTLGQVRHITPLIAHAVAKVAIETQESTLIHADDVLLEEKIAKKITFNMWDPHYLRLLKM